MQFVTNHGLSPEWHAVTLMQHSLSLELLTQMPKQPHAIAADGRINACMLRSCD